MILKFANLCLYTGYAAYCGADGTAVRFQVDSACAQLP
jgi:hypothetical protein